jgi:antirestriction protein ArdC
MTYNQAAELGGQVRKGEKGTPIIVPIIAPDETDDDDAVIKRGYFRVRYTTVFNAAQIDGIDFPALPNVTLNEVEINAAAERVVNDMTHKPTLESRRGDRAFYQPVWDHIVLPLREQFNSAGEYYGTLWHEVAHSTGHETRLNREGVTNPHFFGDHEYAAEELLAEFTASFIAGVVGIERDTVENSAAYIASWSKVLQNDPRLIVKAAAAAQRAADYILGTLTTEETETEIVPTAEVVA